MDKVNIKEKLSSFDALWEPKVVGELNGQLVKLVKLKGEYVWHHHEHEDELFWVLTGSLRILLRDQEIALKPGEFYIVPRGVEHKPVSDELASVLLFEPAATRNTGNMDHKYTLEPDQLERI